MSVVHDHEVVAVRCLSRTGKQTDGDCASTPFVSRRRVGQGGIPRVMLRGSTSSSCPIGICDIGCRSHAEQATFGKLETLEHRFL